MGSGIQSRIEKLKKRKDLIESRMQDIDNLLEENSLEVEDLSTKFRSLIGKAKRPTFLVNEWRSLLDEADATLKLGSGQDSLFKLDSGVETEDDS
jgi:hypothetical protein